MKKVSSFFTLVLVILLSISVEKAEAQSMGKQTVAMMQESPAGSKIIRFIKAVNKGEPVSEEFIKTIFHEDLIAKAGLGRLKEIMENDIPQNDGKLTVYLMKRTERYKFEIFVKGSKSNEWLKMEFLHKGANPYRIVSLGLDAIDNAPEGVDKPIKLD